MKNHHLRLVWGSFLFLHAIGALLRAQSPGTLDEGFEAGAGISFTTAARPVGALQSDGKLVLLGAISPWPGIARVNRDGSLDRTFAVSTGFSFANAMEPVAMATQADDKILIGGFFNSYEGVSRRGLLRLNADGSLDTAFNPGAALEAGIFGTLVVRHLFAQTDGKFVAAGVFSYTSNNVLRKDIVRFHADGSVDQGFTPDPAMPRISAIDVTGAGQIVLSYQQEISEGVFQGKVVRLLGNGTVDPSFDTGVGFTQSSSSPFFTDTVAREPETLEIEADGRVLAAGLFDAYNGTPAGGFIRLTTSGARDPDFLNHGLRDTGTEGPVIYNRNARFLSIKSDGGVIYVGGQFNRHGTPDGPVRQGFARLLGNGLLDTTFNPGNPGPANAYASVILTRPDTDQALVLGNYRRVAGVMVPGIAQFSSAGLLDPVFNINLQQGLDGPPTAVTVQDDGKLLVSGFFAAVNGVPRPGLVRLQKDGVFDPGFSVGTGFISTLSDGSQSANSPESLAVQQDGRIVVAVPFFTNLQGLERNSLARLHADGSVDPSFDAGTGLYYEYVRGRATAVALWNDNRPGAAPSLQKIIAVGSFTHLVQCGVTHPREGILRLNEDGMLDPSFNPGTGFTNPELRHALMRFVAVQPDGKILVAGDPVAYNGTPVPRLVRLNGDASLDTTFNAAGPIGNTTTIQAMDLLPNGQIMVAGYFFTDETGLRAEVVRLNADGSRDPGFNPGTGFGGNFGGVLYDMAVQPDGKVVVGGRFLSYRGVPRTSIARLHTDGSLDVGFNPGAGILGDPDAAAITTVALQSEGKALIGGSFYRFDGTVRPYLARLQGDSPPASPGLLQFASGTVTIKEKDGTIRFTVRRAGGTAGAVTVGYATSPGSAQSGGDFADSNGTLTWMPGDSGAKFIDVPVTADSLAEGTESFTVALTNATGGAGLGLALSTANLVDPPFDAWRWQNFGSEANHPDRGGALADFDRDGFVNLVEYGLGLSPLISSTADISFARDTSGQPTLTFTRNPLAKNELTYIVQTSGDLQEWTNGSTYSPAGNVLATGTTSDITPQGFPAGYTVVRNDDYFNTSRHYMRLRISRP